jgi:hypothetical protein
MKGGAEHDTFSSHRNVWCYLDHPGVAKGIKRKYNKRARYEAKQKCLESQLDLDEGGVDLPRDTSDSGTD